MIETFAGISEPGLVRDINQDSILMQTGHESGLFVVADGMGGHSHGERASQTITSYLDEWWNGFTPERYNNDFSLMIASIGDVVRNANRDIRKGTEPGQLCGSTLILLFIYKDMYACMSAGDSRMYLTQGSKVRQLSVDETWENLPGNDLPMRKKLKHPDYGKLVNAIGCFEQFGLTSKTDVLPKGAVFTLCSDGIYKYATPRFFDKRLAKMGRDNLLSTIDNIKTNVYDNGARDNLSIILVSTQK